MTDEQEYHLWLTDQYLDETMSDGLPVEMGRWYHIGVDYKKPHWWKRLKRKLGYVKYENSALKN